MAPPASLQLQQIDSSPFFSIVFAVWGAIHACTVVDQFLSYEIFSYIKFFDEAKTDQDPTNFYMEREWRVLGKVQFSLEDVSRVILPEKFAKRFRSDVPDYYRQVTFIDPPSSA